MLVITVIDHHFKLLDRSLGISNPLPAPLEQHKAQQYFNNSPDTSMEVGFLEGGTCLSILATPWYWRQIERPEYRLNQPPRIQGSESYLIWLSKSSGVLVGLPFEVNSYLDSYKIDISYVITVWDQILAIAITQTTFGLHDQCCL